MPRPFLHTFPGFCQYREGTPLCVGHSVHPTLRHLLRSLIAGREGKWGPGWDPRTLSSAPEPLSRGDHYQFSGKGELTPDREKGYRGPQGHLSFNSQKSAYSCTHCYDLVPQRDRKQNQQREKVDGAKSGGNQTQASQTPLPGRSHRICLIPLATSCADVYKGVCWGSRDSLPRVLLGLVTRPPST